VYRTFVLIGVPSLSVSICRDLLPTLAVAPLLPSDRSHFLLVMKSAKGTGESAPAMGMSLTFKNERGAVVDFVDEVVLQEATKEFKKARPAEFKHMKYETLEKKERELENDELDFVGTLFARRCSGF
jgi:hypothetical protein